MNSSEIIADSTQAINLILMASLPPVIVAAVIGVLVSLVQALTQIQEQTLAFGFKLIAVILTLLVMMETLGSEFLTFTEYIFNKISYSYSWLGEEATQSQILMSENPKNIIDNSAEHNRESAPLELDTEDGMEMEIEQAQDLPAESMEESKEVLEGSVDRDDAGGAETAGTQAPTDAASLALEKLSVKIDFHIGSITLPVQNLTSLAPGWTLSDLPHLTFPKIIAFSAGRPFAEGELVEIDGKIGFRVTQVLP